MTKTDNDWDAPARLVYLADILRIPVPKKILRLLPEGRIIESIILRGVKATAIELNLPVDQLVHLYDEGRNQDNTTASEDEYRMIISQAAMQSLEFEHENLALTVRVALISEIADFVNAQRSQLIDFEEVSLANVDTKKGNLELPTFETGFQPLDVLMGGGLAQTLVTLIARPGTGKTSTFLTIMGELRKTNAASSIWFFSLEMPLQMMEYRATKLIETIDFGDDDKFFCGSYTPANILAMIDASPDPDRVIIYDSPDALGGGSDQRRFVLEDLFRDLVKVKTNSKCVLTASQPRRADRVLSLDSVAESWAKAWYSDVVLTITNGGNIPRSEFSRMRMETVKNRFGRSGMAVEYNYNYRTLEYQDTHSSTEATGWGNSNELRDAVGDETPSNSQDGSGW